MSDEFDTLTNEEFNNLVSSFLDNSIKYTHHNFVTDLCKEATGYASMGDWYDDNEAELESEIAAQEESDYFQFDEFVIEDEITRFIDRLDDAVMAVDFKQMEHFGDFYDDFVEVTGYAGSMEQFEYDLRRSTVFFEFAVATIINED